MLGLALIAATALRIETLTSNLRTMAQDKLFHVHMALDEVFE